ncbi:MAG: hypothetical protein ACK47B_03285 [Armatimonadota bacterium]
MRDPETFQIARLLVGSLFAIVGLALMRGYQLHGWLGGGEWREGFGLGAVLGLVGLGLMADLLLKKTR